MDEGHLTSPGLGGSNDNTFQYPYAGKRVNGTPFHKGVVTDLLYVYKVVHTSCRKFGQQRNVSTQNLKSL